ncbi:MAG: 6-carboxytetrahydropterin synthase [Ignisphaera sp.]|nr:6-carboxytetrahydropterin synthase [Ignisphaera sp.]
MPKTTISKRFEFAYGHRVHAQVLDPILSCGSGCKCRQIHGHSGIVVATLSSDKLNSEGMVMDFTELKLFKKWIDDTLDHKFLIDIDDPLFTQITNRERGDVQWKGDVGSFEEQDEMNISFVVLGFIPTSEMIAEFLYERLNQIIPAWVKVDSIEFKESDSSGAIYAA